MRQPQALLNVSDSFLIQTEEPEAIFETVVVQAIDDILSALGNDGKQAIYRHLKNNYGLTESEIPYKIEDFARAIEQTFGSVAKLIEIKIIQRLHEKYKDFSYVPKKEELNFVEFVHSLQRHLESEA